MRKWLTLLVFLMPTTLWAQSTTVSGTVIDTDTQAWFNGTVVATFVPASGTTLGQYTWSGGAFNPGQPITTTIGATGSYSVSIPSNTAITPGGSKWTFTASSGTTSLNTQSAVATVTGGTQTLNFTPTGIRISAGPGAVAYLDLEVSAQVGQGYFQLNVTPASATNRVCQVVTAGSCTTWAAAGGGTTVSPKNIIDITAAPYNVVFDAKWDINTTYNTAATTCSGNTVPAGTCITIAGVNGATFTSTAVDGGKIGFGYVNCPNTGEQCSAVGVGRTTITTVFDSTHAQVANAATTTGTGGTFVWGTVGQTTVVRNAFAAMSASTSTASAIMFPCLTGAQSGGLIWDGGINIAQHTANIGVYGCPSGTSVVIPTRDLPGGISGSTGDIFNDLGTGVGQGNTTQYGTGDTFKNVLFWGAGAPSNTFGTSNHAAISITGPALLENFSIEAYLWNIGGGFTYSGLSCTTCTIVNSTDFAGGNTANVSNADVNGGVWGAGNAGFPGLTASGAGSGNGGEGVTIRNAFVFGGLSTTQVGLSVPATNARTVEVVGSHVENINMAGGKLVIRSNGVSNSAIILTPLTITGGVVEVQDNTWTISNNQPWVVCTGGTLRSLGGNTGLTGTGGFTITPPCTFEADGHSVKAVCTGTVTASTTIALISTGTSLTGTALTTACTGTTLDKGIPVQGARTLQNLICTSSATTVAVVCTVMTSHNGGAFASSGVTCTMTAATSCTDGIHTLALADGDFVTIQAAGGAAETGANIKAIAEWE